MKIISFSTDAEAFVVYLYDDLKLSRITAFQSLQLSKLTSEQKYKKKLTRNRSKQIEIFRIKIFSIVETVKMRYRFGEKIIRHRSEILNWMEHVNLLMYWRVSRSRWAHWKFITKVDLRKSNLDKLNGSRWVSSFPADEKCQQLFC